MKIEWEKDHVGCWRAEIGDIVLFASPDRVNYGRPVRGTKWHAGVSIWDEKTRTLSRYGKDVYLTLFDSADDAKKAAENIYIEAKEQC